MAFEFDRYINGTLMAEGVIIERQKNLADAMREAARIASRGPNGEAPVLVLRAEAAERVLAERAGGVKVPIGYALVPVEPTDRMVSAYVAAKPKGAGFNHPRKGDDKKAWFAAHEKKCRERWKAMLSVSTLTTEPAAPDHSPDAGNMVEPEAVTSIFPTEQNDVNHIHPIAAPAIPLGRNNDIDCGGFSMREPINDAVITIRPKEAAPEGRQGVCATEGCDNHATNQFIRGGVGSTYCGDCFVKVIEACETTRPAEQAVTEAKPFAFCVHDFHVARMPVKARGKFEEPTEYYYPASRENDARETARLMGATCTPLYAGKESA